MNVRQPTSFPRFMLCAGVIAAVCCSVSHAQEGRRRAVDDGIREYGVLESARSVQIRSAVPGQVAILVMAPEGAAVKKGELIIELDDSALRQAVEQNRIEFAQARAALEKAEAAVVSAKRQGEARLSVAKMALKATLIEREHILGNGGELATKLLEIDGQLAIAKSKYALAERLLELAKKAEDLGQVAELESARLEARETIRVNEARKRFVASSETPRRKAAIELAVAERELDVLTATNTREASLQAASATLAAQRIATEIEERSLKESLEQLESCKIHAPQDGFIVYPASSSGRSRRTSLEVGAMVRERQVIAQLPDPKQLQVRVNVNESRIAQIKRGQAAMIRFDALPDKTVAGTVTRISSTPEPSSWLSEDVKEYAVIVSLKEPPAGLRLGLSASVQISVR